MFFLQEIIYIDQNSVLHQAVNMFISAVKLGMLIWGLSPLFFSRPQVAFPLALWRWLYFQPWWLLRGVAPLCLHFLTAV